MHLRSHASARLGLRSITSKLLASLLLLTAVGVAAIGVVYWNHQAVQRSMSELTDVAQPLDAAAHEMEINAIGTGLAVSQYLATGDDAHSIRLEDDTGDFRRASDRYARLADTAEEMRLGVELRRLYERFRSLGTSMMARRDKRVTASRRTFATFGRLDGVLGGLDEDDPTVARLKHAMEADVAELEGALGAAIAGGDDRHPRRIRYELGALTVRLAALRPRSGERRLLTRAGRRLADAGAGARRVLALEASMTADTPRFSGLRGRIDDLLDERAQRLARERVGRADERIDRSFAVAEHAWLALGALFVVLTIGALVVLGRAITRPMSRLTAGTSAVAGGDLDHRIDGLKEDEFGLLATHFNRMVERLQQTLVSNEALEQSEAELRSMASRLAVEASTDTLTGLANRREFERSLEAAIADAFASDREHLLCYLDLDQFKVINDTRGHAAGDALLRGVAGVLLARLRPDDLVARLGGDEFGVILRDCALADGLRVAEELRHDLHSLRFEWDGSVFAVSVSVGVVPVQAAGGDSQDALKAADSACYAAKERGRNRVQVYGPDDGELVERQSQLHSIPRLTSALDADRFVLDAQPIVALRPDAGEPAHYEVLVRMIDEHGRKVPPGAFIPAAERYGLTPRIDGWVVRTALAHVAARLDASRPAEICSINLSATSLAAPDMIASIEHELDHSGVPPSAICFEITETAAMTDLATAMRFIERLKSIGCRFALDDFGKGMSSFAYLKHLPVDYLKIDGGFVRDICADPVAAALVESVNHVGHVVGARTIAECVEDEATRDRLAEMGVDFVQGFGISMPRPLDELLGRPLTRDSQALGSSAATLRQ